MKIKNKKDFGLGVFSILFSLWIYYMTTTLTYTGRGNDPGPTLFPLIGAGIMFICGLILIIKPGKESKKFMTAQQWKSAGVILAIYCFCAVLFWLIGFMLTVPIILFIITLLFQGQSRPDDPLKKRIIRSVIYAIVAGVAIYVIYVVGLQAKLPTGMLF